MTLTIEYRNKTYSGETERDLFLALRRNARLTEKEIGKLVGKSKQWVGQVLGPVGRLEFPELNDPRTFLESDEMIAFNLNLPISRVAAARRRLGLKSRTKVNMIQRRIRLARELFGYCPGPQFTDFIKEQIQNLPAGKAKALEEFYILGMKQSLADNVNMDTGRVYRHKAKKELKEIVLQFSADELKRKGVIVNG